MKRSKLIAVTIVVAVAVLMTYLLATYTDYSYVVATSLMVMWAGVMTLDIWTLMKWWGDSVECSYALSAWGTVSLMFFIEHIIECRYHINVTGLWYSNTLLVIALALYAVALVLRRMAEKQGA